MKKIYNFSFLFLFINLVSCVSHIPIKGKYSESSIKAEFNYSYDKVWEGIIELIAERGLDIKMIDKSSGLIMSDRGSFFGYNTYEEAIGKPDNPKAYILTSRTSDKYKPVTYTDVTAVYNIRAKSDGPDKTLVSINVHSIRFSQGVIFPYKGLSLGNFERSLFDDINYYLNKK